MNEWKMGNRVRDTIKALENALNEENHKCERKHMYIVLEKGEYESHSLPEHAQRLLCVGGPAVVFTVRHEQRS